MTLEIAVEFRSLSSVLPASARLHGESRFGQRHETRSEAALDEALAESFPASDPPAWNQGITRPVPVSQAKSDAHLDGRDAGRGGAAAERHDVRSPPGRSVLQAFTSQAGALGIVLLVPLAILALGIPIALVLRGVIEAVGWLWR